MRQPHTGPHGVWVGAEFEDSVLREEDLPNPILLSNLNRFATKGLGMCT